MNQMKGFFIENILKEKGPIDKDRTWLYILGNPELKPRHYCCCYNGRIHNDERDHHRCHRCNSRRSIHQSEDDDYDFLLFVVAAGRLAPDRKDSRSRTFGLLDRGL